ncbi:PREDICTED: protein HIRA [Bison bison bison]|uniref:Protein HIRA n=1 Tax=Bison bison bison TaxID=43346 RepID=A0A6P3GTN3_BISBB|nr:PREDICTED: protein HIRA [Bison bison bison]
MCLSPLFPGKPIFSVDIHPDGTKFATGGQGQDSGKVVIWNMSPVLQEDDEKDENVPKMLCQMDNHLACVNCVRWSNGGMYLASGGDDKLIMVWKRATYIGPSTVFGSGGKLANVEQWRCVSILRSHSGDVMDVAWSPHDAWLASCSVDNTVVIWNAVKFPEILATLRGHSGLVKGLTWDPVGKYIASQADDRSLKVWRTLDWQLETSITKPFDECGGTTHVLRLSWSPDGHYLVSAHAMNNSGPTAQIIEREGWKTNMDFVGHRKAVTVVKFNPKIFKKKQKNGSSAKPSCPYCCCAVGSKDRSLSVWLTCLKRPLVVIHELFDKSIMDISWTLNGLGILVCSMDGSVAFLDFSQDELGDPLSEEEKSRIHQSTYGKSLAIMTEAQLSTAVIENPEMLQYQRRQQQLDRQGPTARDAGPAARDTGSASSVAGGLRIFPWVLCSPGVQVRGMGRAQTELGAKTVPRHSCSRAHVLNQGLRLVASKRPSRGELGSRPCRPCPLTGTDASLWFVSLLCQNLLKKQVETRTADGRRRITPLCIAQLDTGDFSTAFFNSIPLSGSLAGPMLSSHSGPQLLPLDPSTPIPFSSSKPSTEPAAGTRPVGDAASKDGVNTATAPTTPSPSVLTTPSKIEPMKAFDSRFTERSKATPGTPALASTTPTAAERLREQSLVKELRPRDVLESSSDSDEKAPAAKPSSLPKRKLELEGEAVEKKKKGRPRKDARLLPMSLSMQSPAALTAEKDTVCVSVPAPALKLPMPGPQRAFTLQVSSDPSMYIEVENEVTAGGGLKLSRLKCSREGKEWETVLPGRILTAAGSGHESRHWLLLYARYLVNEGFEYRLREICKDLLGPVHTSTGSQWESTVVGLRKRDLLKELLPVIGQNLRFQRLFTECQEQLDLLRDK